MNSDTTIENTGTSRIKDILKLIAIVLMTTDHIAEIFLAPGTFLYTLFQFTGNTTIIFMSYFLVQGFKYTSSYFKYLSRLLIAGCIAELPFYILLGHRMNIMFTLAASLILLEIIKKGGRYMGWIYGLFAFSFYFLFSFYFDWYFLAPIFVLSFYISYSSAPRLIAASVINSTIYALVALGSKESIGFSFNFYSMLLPFLVIIFFQGFLETIKPRKIISPWFFYFYYPGHLFVLWLVKYIIS